MQDRSKVGRTGGAKERKKWRFECSDAQPDTGPTAWLVAAVLPLPIAAAGDLEPTSNPLFFELAPVRPRGLAGNCPLIGFRSAVCPTKRPAGAVAGDTSSRSRWFPEFPRRSWAAFCSGLGRFFLGHHRPSHRGQLPQIVRQHSPPPPVADAQTPSVTDPTARPVTSITLARLRNSNWLSAGARSRNRSKSRMIPCRFSPTHSALPNSTSAPALPRTQGRTWVSYRRGGQRPLFVYVPLGEPSLCQRRPKEHDSVGTIPQAGSLRCAHVHRPGRIKSRQGFGPEPRRRS